eukprot:2971419-Amphidinium_carterae.1
MLLIRLMLELVVPGGWPTSRYHQDSTRLQWNHQLVCVRGSRDWLDITELEDARRGPAVKARLEGAAYMYRALRAVLNRDRLKAVNGDGVRYFLDTFVRANSQFFSTVSSRFSNFTAVAKT